MNLTSLYRKNYASHVQTTLPINSSTIFALGAWAQSMSHTKYTAALPAVKCNKKKPHNAVVKVWNSLYSQQWNMLDKKSWQKSHCLWEKSFLFACLSWCPLSCCSWTFIRPPGIMSVQKKDSYSRPDSAVCAHYTLHTCWKSMISWKKI